MNVALHFQWSICPFFSTGWCVCVKLVRKFSVFHIRSWQRSIQCSTPLALKFSSTSSCHLDVSPTFSFSPRVSLHNCSHCTMASCSPHMFQPIYSYHLNKCGYVFSIKFSSISTFVLLLISCWSFFKS